MTVNTDKSIVMYFGSKKKIKDSIDLSITMGTDILPTTNQYCYLGVELDSGLTVGPQVSKVKKSVSNKLYKLSRLRKIIPESTSLITYKSMILPVLDYCSFYTRSAC